MRECQTLGRGRRRTRNHYFQLVFRMDPVAHYPRGRVGGGAGNNGNPLVAVPTLSFFFFFLGFVQPRGHRHAELVRRLAEGEQKPALLIAGGVQC